MDENRKNEHGADVNQTPAPETTKVHPTLSWGKICRRAALVLCSLLLLVLASVIAALGLLQTGNGQAIQAVGPFPERRFPAAPERFFIEPLFDDLQIAVILRKQMIHVLLEQLLNVASYQENILKLCRLFYFLVQPIL